MPVRRQQTTSEAVAAINARFPGALIKGSDPSLVIEHLPTGILSLDVIMGGFARGRHIEIYGGYGVGKTYTAYCFIATSQADGLRCAFLDVEGTFDPDFAQHCGVNTDKLEFPTRGQNANRLVNIMEVLLRSGEYDVIVLDSIAALLPKDEEDSDMESGSYGMSQAKLMSQALRRLTTANQRTVCVYINQTREAIGVMFGKRSITSGGRAMPFYAGTRLEMVRTESIKRKRRQINHKTGAEAKVDIVRGHRVLVRVEKDKTGAAQQGDETTFVFSYDLAKHDEVEDLVYLGRRFRLIKIRSGQWAIEGYESHHGRARFLAWLRANPNVQSDLTEEIWEAARAAKDVGPDGEVAEQAAGDS